MSEPVKATPNDFSAAAAAVAAAATAAGQPPADPSARAAWVGEVHTLALDLLAPTMSIARTVARVGDDGTRPIPGIILAADIEESSGRALIAFRPLIGNKAGDGDDAREFVRTERLSDSVEARQMLATAQGAIGAKVTIYKYNETAASDPNKKIGMAAAIFVAAGPAAAPTAPPVQNTGPAQDPPAQDPPAADPAPAQDPAPAGDTSGGAETPTVPELRAMRPANKTEIATLAGELFGFDKAYLKEVADSMFAGKPKLTAVELTDLWQALVSRYEATL